MEKLTKNPPFRAQATQQKSGHIIRGVIRAEGTRGFYRGFAPTLMREIPFSIIQFPLWEYFKARGHCHVPYYYDEI